MRRTRASDRAGRRTRSGGLPTTLAGALALGVVVAGTLLTQSLTGEPDRGAAPGARPAVEVTEPRPGSGPDADPAPGSAGPAVRDGLPTVTAAALPPEARRTLVLIDDGGPFPYDRDGVTFGNREGLLPQERRGCYREYTVRTPGESDRGARRIVTSCAGPRYWTADHYESFRRIVPARL